MNDTTNNSNELINYLQTTYEGAKVEQLPNGGYYVSNWKGNGNLSGSELYLPPNFDTTTNLSVVAHLPGSGGSRNDARFVRESFMSENAPEYAIAISSHYSDNAEILDCVSNICHDNNVNIENVSLTSFSASGGQSFVTLENFLDKNPNTNATLFVADGYSCGSSSMEAYSSYINNLDSLVESQTPVYLIMPAGNVNRLNKFTQQLIEAGVNVNIITTDRGDHVTVNHDFIQSYMAEYSIGLVEDLQGANLEKCNYTIRIYDPENPEADKNGYVYYNDFEMLRHGNASFGYNLEKLESNPFDEGTVASDMYQIVNSINSIRSCISSNTVQVPTYNSTSTIPGSFAEAETSLIGISSDLNSTIYKETQVISSIAQVFYDMDRERTNAASQLSNGSEISFDESAYTDVLNQLINVDVSGEMHFGQFLFSPSSHVEGNSGKICLSDINSMLSGSSLSGPLHENLENERVSARNTKQEIDGLNTMITSGTNFQGDIWKAVSARLDEYSELMDLRIESADALEEAMVKALTLIKDYMGDYEELDDSKLPELRDRVEQIKQAIMDAQNIIDATHTVTKTYQDDRGGTNYYYVTEYVYSAGARRAAREYIVQATSLLREVEKEIVKLEGLPIILAQAEQIVNDALSQVYNKYGVKVSNVVCGKEVSYIPPANTTYTAPDMPKYNPWIYVKKTPEGKLKPEDFYRNQDLRNEYGANYDDYLNGVTRENNPMYNTSMEDKGIEPGQSLNDKILGKDEDVPEETTPEDENNSNEDTEVPDTEKPIESPQQEKPTSPQNPTQPNPQNPSTPSQPEKPSEPSSPSAPTQPEKPSEPSSPSAPTQPEKPSEPSSPSTPTQPEKPSEPSSPSSPTQPEKPSEPSSPSTPSKPNTPSRPSTTTQPSNPSTPTIPIIPDDNSAGYPDTPIIPDEVYPEDGDLAIGDNIGNNNINQDIPPIIEIPENNVGNDIVDITPPSHNEIPNSNDRSGDLLKTVGIISGVGAAVGAAALGAHTISKAKKNDMYEDE